MKIRNAKCEHQRLVCAHLTKFHVLAPRCIAMTHFLSDSRAAMRPRVHERIFDEVEIDFPDAI